MSVSSSPACLFCRFSRSLVRPSFSRRDFHAAQRYLARKGERQSPEEPPLKRADISREKLRGYNDEEKERLAEKYTPEQVAAVESGEKAVDPDHLAAQATSRLNHWSLRYLDDLSNIDPVVDHPLRAPYSNTDPNLRLKTPDELAEDLARFIHEMPPEDSPKAEEAWTNFEQNLRLTVGREEAERDARSAEAPELFRPGEVNLHDKVLPDPNATMVDKKRARTTDENINPQVSHLMQATGFSKRQILDLQIKTIAVHRVVNQTRLGKIAKWQMLSIAGNGNGLVGLGEGKSALPADARLESISRAVRGMKPILRYESRTILGDVKGKVSGTELELYSRPPGFGLRCQRNIWEICRCAGISDLAARVTRSRNPRNTAKAAVEALWSQKDPEEIAKARGRKMVDVRKVYYAGLV